MSLQDDNQLLRSAGQSQERGRPGVCPVQTVSVEYRQFYILSQVVGIFTSINSCSQKVDL
jgi:hypothetical protein